VSCNAKSVCWQTDGKDFESVLDKIPTVTTREMKTDFILEKIPL
jgi:hypothetical protein